MLMVYVSIKEDAMHLLNYLLEYSKQLKKSLGDVLHVFLGQH